ncbi:UPF0764 protein C16orf89 homolog isoform X4 [Octodon degus]|uniref:UPF0764 protein C16orf89 homolog isoform X4 n=1 Tax=Octodon degus TaxID=10160 RepID=A0A6P6E592_OCTDE|nr:UPF0764 protein C16orf89 homolog isoform X4 [Octodon degus]
MTRKPVMARPGLALFLLLLSSLSLKPSSLPQLDGTEGKATLAGLILSTLERATMFLEERLPEINLDGVVGFQVLEAQLRGAQEAWASDPVLQPLCLRTGQLADKLAPLLHRSITYLNLSDPEYLREFQPSLQPGFWKLPHTWTHTSASLVYPWPELQYSFSEDSSDACLVLLLGTGNTSSQPCGLSDFCRKFMTKPGCSGYYLSHQMLFFLWARMSCSVALVASLTSTSSGGWRPYSAGRSHRKDALECLILRVKCNLHTFCTNSMFSEESRGERNNSQMAVPATALPQQSQPWAASSTSWQISLWCVRTSSSQPSHGSITALDLL